MKLNFTFKHLDRSESLESYVADKLDEVGKFLLKDGFANVYCSKQNHEFCVEVSVNTREKYFKAMAFHSDPYMAADLVMAKLEKQFLKTKRLVQNHRKPELSREGRLERMNDRFEASLRFKKAA